MARSNRPLLLAAVVVLVALGGCGAVLGDEPLEFTASETTIPDDALATAGYEAMDRHSFGMNETVEAVGQERTVLVTNHLVTYSKAVELGPLGERQASTVAVLSSPQVTVVGQSLNPLGHLSNEDLMGYVLEDSAEVDDVRQVDERTLTVAGEETPVTVFGGTTEFAGQTVDVYLYLATVDVGDDHLVVFGMHPTALPDEADDIYALFEAIELVT